MTVPPRLALPAGFNELRQTRIGPMLYNRNDHYVGGSIRRYGEFSHGEAEMFRQCVGLGNTAIDAGANIGAHTVLLSRLVGPLGRVYAYEPQRIVFQTLCANLALNQTTNVYARQGGVGREPMTLRVPFISPERRGNFGGLSLQADGEGEAVPVTTIDSEALAACHFVKVDVEGMELDVLIGAAATIRRFRPILYLENDRADRSAALIRHVLGLGYRAWWHLTPLFNPDNFAGERENAFPGTVSVNMVCVHGEPPPHIAGLPEITGPDTTWQQFALQQAKTRGVL